MTPPARGGVTPEKEPPGARPYWVGSIWAFCIAGRKLAEFG